MTHKILVTTTSFSDTPGRHRERLQQTGYEIVAARGPFKESELLSLVGDGTQFDGYLCGEDEFTATVLQAVATRGKVISKYGVGLDRVDLDEAARLGIKVTNTPGVNHTTVTEHTFGLMLSLARHIPEENAFVHRGEWRRITGNELVGKTLGIVGFGRVGKEVAKRAMAFGMNVVIYNTSWSAPHLAIVEELNTVFSHPIFSEYPPTARRAESDTDLLASSDFVSLHMNLTKNNMNFINRRRIQQCRRGVYFVNVSRGALVDENAMAAGVQSGQVAGYAADVMATEPIKADCPLLGLRNVILTPHIGSRTQESIERQGVAAVDNLVGVLSGATS